MLEEVFYRPKAVDIPWTSHGEEPAFPGLRRGSNTVIPLFLFLHYRQNYNFFFFFFFWKKNIFENKLLQAAADAYHRPTPSGVSQYQRSANLWLIKKHGRRLLPGLCGITALTRTVYPLRKLPIKDSSVIKNIKQMSQVKCQMTNGWL